VTTESTAALEPTGMHREYRRSCVHRQWRQSERILKVGRYRYVPSQGCRWQSNSVLWTSWLSVSYGMVCWPWN